MMNNLPTRFVKNFGSPARRLLPAFVKNRDDNKSGAKSVSKRVLFETVLNYPIKGRFQ